MTNPKATERQGQKSFNRSLMLFGLWARRVRLPRRLAVLLAVGALISGAATYAVMTGWAPTDPDSNAVLILLQLDLVLLLLLLAVVARQMVALWLARRAGGAGSRLHLRLVGLFSVVAVTPAILVAIFSALFFDIGVQAWFGERVRTALDESQAVAEAYLKEHKQVIAGQVLGVANDLQRSWAQLTLNDQNLERFLARQTSLRGLTEAVIFEPRGKVLARAGYTFALHFEEVPFWALERAENGEVAVLTGETEDRVRALVKLDTIPSVFLYVGRFVDPAVVQHITRTNKAVEQYWSLQEGRANLEVTFSLIFIVVALLLLLAAVWVGLTIATRLAKPIGQLIDASEQVSEGNLDVRVTEIVASDEIATLSRAFNRMTDRLARQQERLLSTNRELDERNRFTETVLSGVSAGVLSVGVDGTITLANRSACELLHQERDSLVGQPLQDAVPEFTELLDLVARREQAAQREVEVRRDGKVLTFLVRAAAENLGTELIGHVLTFDDITELQAAQRKAAWADVARRIAHEIKNPLTPIQLSAERLKRRYSKQIEDGSDVFIQCTDTIIRHVGDIGRMVDEFSAFARMPSPVMKRENLNSIVSQAVFLQRTAYPQIAFTTELPDTPVRMPCDARQLNQALTNLLKNSVEAIEGSARADAGTIAVHLASEPAGEGHKITITVVDNGKGLPDKDRARLTEPYVTTRSKGTGLGLAIVKKILEDHGGDLILEDNPGGGARVSMVFHSGAETTATGSSSTGTSVKNGA